MRTDARIAELARDLSQSSELRDRIIAGILMWAAGIYCESGPALLAAADRCHAYSLSFVSAAKEAEHAN
jgi:hypothetical protein